MLPLAGRASASVHASLIPLPNGLRDLAPCSDGGGDEADCDPVCFLLPQVKLQKQSCYCAGDLTLGSQFLTDILQWFACGHLLFLKDYVASDIV